MDLPMTFGVKGGGGRPCLLDGIGLPAAAVVVVVSAVPARRNSVLAARARTRAAARGAPYFTSISPIQGVGASGVVPHSSFDGSFYFGRGTGRRRGGPYYKV